MHHLVHNAKMKSRYRVKGVPSNGGGLNTLVVFVEKIWTHTSSVPHFIDKPFAMV